MTDETCLWCSHPVDLHYDGGCNVSAHTDAPQCGCSHDPDYHSPEPERPEPWGNA